MQRLPWDRVLEFRGREAEGYSFTAKDTGEVVELAPMLRFEFETDDGDVGLVELRGSAFDKARGSIDYKDLKRGQKVRVQGVINLQDRGSGKDSYFSVTAIDLAADGRPAAALKS